MKRRRLVIAVRVVSIDQKRPLFSAHDTDWLNRIRTINMMNDGHWIFEADGEAQPFEEPAVFQQRKIKDRFPLEPLDRWSEGTRHRRLRSNLLHAARYAGLLAETLGNWKTPIKELTSEQSFSRFANRQ